MTVWQEVQIRFRQKISFILLLTCLKDSSFRLIHPKDRLQHRRLLCVCELRFTPTSGAHFFEPTHILLSAKFQLLNRFPFLLACGMQNCQTRLISFVLKISGFLIWNAIAFIHNIYYSMKRQNIICLGKWSQYLLNFISSEKVEAETTRLTKIYCLNIVQKSKKKYISICFLS